MPNFAGQSSGYRYSYSGADARASAYFLGRADKATHLESLHTISWSVHEGKGQARSLGYKGIRGISRGVRTIAGSLIMTVIEDNPLAKVMDMMAELANDPSMRLEGWSMDWRDVGVGSGIDGTVFNRRLAVTLPPLNILVQYVAEGSQWVTHTDVGSTVSGLTTSVPGAAFLLEGVEFIDEGLVTSTQDSATEATYSFLATNIRTFSAQTFAQSSNTLLLPLDPAMASAGELQRLLSGNYYQQAENYKSSTQAFSQEDGGFSVANTNTRLD